MIKKIFTLLLMLVFVGLNIAEAQTKVSGNMKDSDTGEALIGVNIIVKGSVFGTVTDYDGNYSLNVKQEPPFTIVYSLVGYATKEVEITQKVQVVNLNLGSEAILGQEVVVSASRVEEKLLESPVTIEKLDVIAIRNSSSADYYDDLKKLKGVHSNEASMTFTTINTRGFATAGNTRFVQLMDGMDNAAPLLNFPTGNVVGIGELDIHDVELVPGAASALYGPNAFNGILLMNSKNPFDYQGLSAQVKYGYSKSEAVGKSEPLGSVGVRWAQQLGDKFAYKVNFSLSSANDWAANDYKTDRNTGTQDRTNASNFDGLNAYGDEVQIGPLPFAGYLEPSLTPFLAYAFSQETGLPTEYLAPIISANLNLLNPIQLTRTGIPEKYLQDGREAKSMKADLSLNYRINDKWETSYSYRYGKGSAIYQGAERYALRGFSQTFHKLDLKGKNLDFKLYQSRTDAGKSYNFSALGAYTNEELMASSDWVPIYAGTYAGAVMQTVFGHLLAGDTTYNASMLTDEQIQAFHDNARATMNSMLPGYGSDGFKSAVEKIRNGYFQSGGAGFKDDSWMRHAEFNYNLSDLFDNAIGLQMGGNFRKYGLFSSGTIFNEDPDGDGINERILINEYGFYVQAKKALMDDKLKFTGSIRYDKNENFDGNITPRVALVYSTGANNEHNIRASFQTGFRNPTTQGQYIFFPGSRVIIGGTRANAERYGLYEGGAYSSASVAAFRATGGLDPSVLEIQNVDYVKPEKLTAFEIGYKGLLSNKVLLDFNIYYNIYKDFIGEAYVYNKDIVYHKGEVFATPIGREFQIYTNATEIITSLGSGLGITYKLPKNYEFFGNYSYASFSTENDNFNAGFNTPKNRFNVQVSNRKLLKNFGFSINYRWQDSYKWESTFASGDVDAYGTLDGQLSFRLPEMKSILKLGMTNILNKEYRTHVGAPFVGQIGYISLTFDELMH